VFSSDKLRGGVEINMKAAIGAASAALFLLVSLPASASVIYQSIPDLTVAPISEGCSQCSFAGAPDGQDLGQAFSLVTASTLTSITFAIGLNVWPTDVTLSIFENAGSTLGASLFSHTYSSFTSDVPTGQGTDVIGVNLDSGLTLAAGNYILFITNPTSLAVPQYFGQGSGNGIIVQDATSPPDSGTGFRLLGGEDLGLVLNDGAAIPEPATWTMMILGLVGIGYVVRRSRRGKPVVA
jgi:hypothetical protein